MNEMVGWYHQLNGHVLEQTPGDNEGQGSLVCCSPRCHKELDKTEQPNNNKQQPRLTPRRLREPELAIYVC